MTRTTKTSISIKALEELELLPRCRICNQILIAKTDRTKPSELVEWKFSEKESPSHHWMFPSIPPKFGNLCYWHQWLEDQKTNPTLVGKES